MERVHPLVRNHRAERIFALVESRLDLKTCPRLGCADQSYDHIVTDQWTAALVHHNVQKQTMLNLIPLARAKRQVTRRYLESPLARKALQLDFP